MIKAIMEAVYIPVMAKVRIGHTVEAQILQAVGVDYIDVSFGTVFAFCLLDFLSRHRPAATPPR